MGGGAFSQILASCNGSHVLYLTGSGTTVWPGLVDPTWSFSSIVVGENHTLIVPKGSTISFTLDGMLEVMSDGKLELNGVLTSCDDFWQGVRLRGPLGYPSNLNHQSQFLGKSHGRIENAKVGIGAWTEGVGYETTHGTGVIECEGTFFVNNQIGVKIKPYHAGLWTPFPKPPSLQVASFVGCKFLKTDDSYFSNYVNFVELNDVVADGNPQAVFFKGCRFYQEKNNPSPKLRGILTTGSRLYVKSCAFLTLPKGIEAFPNPPFYSEYLDEWFPASSVPYTVVRSRFNSCAIGIQNSGNTGATIEYNSFALGDLPSAFYGIFENPVVADNQQVGVYFAGSSNGFTFEGNLFAGKLSTPTLTYGSYFRDLGGNSNNVVFKNRYYHLTFGNFAEKYNGNIHEGLTFVCNYSQGQSPVDYFTFDNSLTSGQLAMRLEQGVALGANKFAPPLNRFSWTTADFLAFSFAPYKYYVPNTSVNHYFPLTYAGIQLVPSSEKNNLCGKGIYRFPDESNLTEAEKAINRSNYFENRQAFQQAKLEYESNGSESEKEAARKAMTYYRQEMDAAAYLGYMNVPMDSTYRDSIRVWMNRFDNPAGDYMLVEDYIRGHEYTSATNLLESMPQKYDFSTAELEDHSVVTDIYEELIAANGSDLSNDVILKLEEYADSPDGQARYLARNILTTKGYFFMPTIADVPASSFAGNSTEETIVKRMTVSPNPVDYNATFDWSDFDVAGKQVSIEITNQEGGLVQVLHPEATNYSVEWTTELASDGICYYRLLIDGVESDAGYIIINK